MIWKLFEKWKRMFILRKWDELIKNYSKMGSYLRYIYLEGIEVF